MLFAARATPTSVIRGAGFPDKNRILVQFRANERGEFGLRSGERFHSVAREARFDLVRPCAAAGSDNPGPAHPY
jgi:hypothetical protein